MPDLSDTVAKCRMGTAKNFTLLLLLYHTQVKHPVMKNNLLTEYIIPILRMMTTKKHWKQ